MNLERLFNFGPGHAVSAQDVFTNRVPEIQAVEQLLSDVQQTRREHDDLIVNLARGRRNVHVFYGMGGVGKTELSRELQTRFDTGRLGAISDRRVSIRVDFSQQAAFDLEATLLRMRAGIGRLARKWPAFDLALSAYWERKHPGEPLHRFLDRDSALNRLTQGIGLSTQVQDALDSILGAAGTVGTAWRAGELVRGTIVKRIQQDRLLRGCPFFEPLITEPDPDVARLFLPVLLAWDLLLEQRNRDADVVVFFDTWEAVQAHPAELGGAEDTLARMIYLMPNVAFIITGRSRVTWADLEHAGLKYRGAERWPDLKVGATTSRQSLLGFLSPEDCESYLRERLVLDGGPAIPPEVRTRIIEGSHGLPLYLDLSAARYDELLTAGEPSLEEFGGPLPELVVRVMRDLPAEERELIRVTALVSAFDQQLLRYVMPQHRDAVFERFIQRHFVRTDAHAWLPHSLHDTLRASLRQLDKGEKDTWSEREWRETAQRILDHFGQRVSKEANAVRPSVVQAFLESCTLACEYDLLPDWLFLVAARLAGQGQWQALQYPSALCPERSSNFTALALAGLGLVARMTGSLEEAERRYEEVLQSGLVPGLAREWAEIEHAETLVMLSRYDQAGAELRRIALADNSVKARAVRNLAVLDERKGRFRAALNWASQPNVDEFDQIYAHDLAGWVYFSNGEFERAVKLFKKSLDLSKTIGSPMHEAWVTEHLSWAVSWLDPSEGMALAKRALRLSEELGVKTGVGRALSTVGVAGVGNLGLTEIIDHVTRSYQVLEATRFWPDCLHPLVSEVFVYCAYRNMEGAQRAHQRLLRLTQKLGSHEFLLVIATRWMAVLGEAPEVDPEPVIDWLDSYDAAMERWLKPLQLRWSLLEQHGQG